MTRPNIAPPVPYFGGKQRIASQLVALFPEHEHYVEPFAGSLSVLLAKPPAKLETVNDLDGDLMTFWRILRDRPDDLARACALTPHSRAEHGASRDREDVPDLERARRVWVALTQGRAGQLRRTGWRHHVTPTGTSIGMPAYLGGYVERMPAAARRLASVSLECLPALDVIAKYGADPRALLYVDPPYLGTTRGTTSGYQHELKAEHEHRDLAAALLESRAAVVVSGYASPLYDELFDGWHTASINAYSGQGNASGAQGERTEVIWSNRPLILTPTLDLEAIA
ncbi:DNA adenine methylase [Promicromonospora panici]|uniref:DNA adenine methylase n=1 Tax=Promicromonospora panici TaxID=2219658 RepID=UPI0013E9FAA4|nr:DNA adenine methylase [Promicromonospora panici]